MEARQTEDIRAFIREVEQAQGWYQTYDFGDGLIARGQYDTSEEIRRYQFPADMKGKTYLEVGCNLGATCLDMYRRGAARVVGCDCNPKYVAQASRAARLAGADVEFRVFDVDKEDIVSRLGQFDMIGMFSVIHLSPPIHSNILNPHGVLRNVYNATRDVFITEISSRLQLRYLQWRLWLFFHDKRSLAHRFLRTCPWADVTYIGHGKKERYVFHCHKVASLGVSEQ